jgi:hypothetical protein
VIFTRIAWVLGLAVFVGLCWLASIGFPPAAPLVVTAVVLVVLIGGGNLLRGRSPSGGSGAPRQGS